MKNKKIWEFKKSVLPQHVDHAGVMWHGTYLNWLEEARIDSLNKAGISYIELLKKGYEMPVYDLQIKYHKPLKIGDKITIKSVFDINKGPKIKINSKFYCKNDIFSTEAFLDLVLIDKKTFKIIRKRPKFIDLYFKNLNEGINQN